MSLPSYTNNDGVTVRLTATSSMPCASWSLPAEKACPASKLSVAEYGENAVCAGCYALKGFYRMSNVKGVQSVRFNWVRDSLIADGGTEFVAALVEMIRADVAERGEPIFRVHDSGDLFNVAYIRAWQRIARILDDVQFWIPTRSWCLPNLLPAIQELASLPNVTVRPSALELDDVAPIVAGLAAGTTVVRALPVLDVTANGEAVCPKTNARDGRSNCGDCRTCWEGSQAVAYVLH